MSQSVEREIDLRHYARTLWRRKFIALIPPIVIVAAAAVSVRFLPLKYRVSSTVMYEGRQRMSGALERYILPTSGAAPGGDVESASMMMGMKIRSPGFLSGVVKSLHLDDDPTMRSQEARILAQSAPGRTIEDEIMSRKIDWIRGMISIRGIGPGVYAISAEGGSPKFLYDLVLTIDEHLFNTARQELLSELKAASDFSTEQMEIYKQKLEESQRALQAYESRRTGSQRPVEAIPFDPRAISSLISQTDAEISRASSEAEDLRASARAQTGVAAQKQVVPETEGITLLRDRLDSFERELAWLLMENAWTAPAVVAQNERIGATRKSLGDALQIAVQVVYPAAGHEGQRDLARVALLDLERSSLEVRRESLEERLSAARGSASAGSPVPRSDDELAWFRQKVETNREIYNSFLQQVTSSRITEAVESTQMARGFQIIEPPRWPNRPFAPDKRQILLASLITGLSLGIGFVFFLDYLDHTLKDVDEIERVMGLPILGTIPKIGVQPATPAVSDARRRTLLYALVAVSVVVIIVLFSLRRQV